MKKIIALAISLCAFASVFAQTSVGVYSRIDIGNYPQPRLLYPQPVVIVVSPAAVHRSHIYLYAPQGHQQNWSRYCGRYSACGMPVYFVQEDWVRERYDERRDRGDRPGHSKGQGHKKQKHWDRNDH